MKTFILSLFLVIFSFTDLYSQNTLFDNSKVSSVYIEISLNWIMANIYSDHYCKAMFIYDYGTKQDTLKDVGFRLRGNTSRQSQKKSFKISFNEYVSGRKYQDVKKINLNGQHNDPTLIREKLFYDTWKDAGFAERRTSFVKMYINHVYYGLYTNLEEFDKEWLQKVYGEKSGNLYKCTYPADLVYHGTNQQTYKDIVSGSTTGGRAYELQTNDVADDYSDLIDLITTINQTVDETFAGKIAQKIDVNHFLKAFALDVATGNWDDYMYNKNNYFLYHRTDNGKFEYISYDTDNTFGVDWVNRDWATRDCLDWITHSEPRPLAEKILAVPEYFARYKRYLDTIARQLINPAIIFQHIDSLKVLVTEDVKTDSYRTLDWGYTFADFNNGFTSTIDGHTPYGIKPFLTARYASILQQLSYVSVPEFKSSFSVSLYPNPATDRITIRSTTSNIEIHGFIQDILGRKQKSFIIPKNHDEFTIGVSDLVPGVYNLVIHNYSSIVGRKFIKQ